MVKCILSVRRTQLLVVAIFYSNLFHQQIGLQLPQFFSVIRFPLRFYTRESHLCDFIIRWTYSNLGLPPWISPSGHPSIIRFYNPPRRITRPVRSFRVLTIFFVRDDFPSDIPSSTLPLASPSVQRILSVLLEQTASRSSVGMVDMFHVHKRLCFDLSLYSNYTVNNCWQRGRCFSNKKATTFKI